MANLLDNINRLGRIKIYKDNLFNGFVPKILGQLQITPLRVEHYTDVNETVEYLGLSSNFDIVEPGCLIPIYDVIVSDDNNGKLKLSLRKQFSEF